MKQNFVSVIFLQPTNTPDIYIQPEHYYNFLQNKFSSGELNKSFINILLGGQNAAT
jgi:hypothetical protein